MTELSALKLRYETPARFSIDEFLDLVEADIFRDGSKLELVEGVIVRMSPALSVHMLLQKQIFRKLDAIFGEGIEGWVAHFELTLQFGEDTLRDADVAVVQAFDSSIRFPDPSTVQLIVEISNTTLSRDLNSKRLDYAGAGIQHYWVVDPAKRRIHIMTSPVDGDYTERRPVAFGERLVVPGTNQHIVIEYPN